MLVTCSVVCILLCTLKHIWSCLNRIRDIILNPFSDAFPRPRMHSSTPSEIRGAIQEYNGRNRTSVRAWTEGNVLGRVTFVTLPTVTFHAFQCHGYPRYKPFKEFLNSMSQCCVPAHPRVGIKQHP